MKLVIVVILLLLATVLNAGGRELRITSPDSMTVLSHIDVSPGDAVNLSSDIWLNGTTQRMAPGEFLWSSDDRPTSVCDLFSASACAAETNFRVASWGVQYAVPNDFYRPITISVRVRGGYESAVVILHPRPNQTVRVIEPAPIMPSRAV